MKQIEDIKKYAKLTKNWLVNSIDTVKGVGKAWWIAGAGIIIFLIILGSFYPRMIAGLVVAVIAVGTPWIFEPLEKYRKYTTSMAIVSVSLLILHSFEAGFANSIAISGLLAVVTTLVTRLRFLRYWMYVLLVLMVVWRPFTIHVNPTIHHVYSDGLEDSAGEKNIAFLVDLDTMKALDVEVRGYEIFAWLFDKSSRWKKLAKGNVLDVYTYGIRVPFFGWYPRVVYVKTIAEGKTKEELGIPLNLDR